MADDLSGDISEIDFEVPVHETGTIWRVRGSEDGRVTLEMRQRPSDVFGILDANQQMASVLGRGGKHKDIQPFCRVPLVTLQNWENLGIRYHDDNDAKKVMKLLNSNENYKLLTSQYRG